MHTSSERFRIILNNMSNDRLLNLIWTYDQYVAQVLSDRTKDDWDAAPLNLEGYYHNVFTPIIEGRGFNENK